MIDSNLEIEEIKRVSLILFENDFHVRNAVGSLTFSRFLMESRGYADLYDNSASLDEVSHEYGFDIKSYIHISHLEEFPKPNIRRVDLSLYYHPKRGVTSSEVYTISFIPSALEEKRAFVVADPWDVFIDFNEKDDQIPLNYNLLISVMKKAGYREVKTKEKLDEISFAIFTKGK